MNCKYCNNPVSEGEQFCKNCGKKIKKGDNKLLIIILVFVLLLACTSTAAFLLGRRSVDIPKCIDAEFEKEEEKNDYSLPTTKYSSVEVDLSKVKINFEGKNGNNIKLVKASYGDEISELNILFKNESDTILGVDGELHMLDNDGIRVDKNYATQVFALPNKYFVLRFTNHSKEEYKEFSVLVKANPIKSYEHVKEVKTKDLNVVVEETKISFSYKNNSKKDVGIYATIVYYKNNEIVYGDIAYDVKVKVGLSGSGTFYYNFPGYKYKDETSKYYDKYEIVSAYTYYYDTEY